jgi:hypothetical protein
MWNRCAMILLQAALLVPAGAQTIPDAPFATWDGRMTDSISQRPIIKGIACLYSKAIPAPRCGRTDTTGHFRIDSIPAGAFGLWVSCEMVLKFRWNHLLSAPVNIDTAEHRIKDIRTSAVGCDQRPLTTRTGEFIGYYVSGWEASDFRWSRDTTIWIWVEGGAGRPTTHASLKASGLPQGASEKCIYVRWYGTLVGPGYYGQLGGASHRLTVDSVAETRDAPISKCR